MSYILKLKFPNGEENSRTFDNFEKLSFEIKKAEKDGFETEYFMEDYGGVFYVMWKPNGDF